MSGTTEIEEKKTKPWQWPSEWFRDQSFWRDVGSRTLSGLLVLFFGYWTALLLGFIKSPDNFKNAYLVTGVVLMAIATIIWNQKKPAKPMRLSLQARFPALKGAVGNVVAYAVAFTIQVAMLFLIVIVGLLILRLFFSIAAALLGIEARF
jgi:hypothetical protein